MDNDGVEEVDEKEGDLNEILAKAIESRKTELQTGREAPGPSFMNKFKASVE